MSGKKNFFALFFFCGKKRHIMFVFFRQCWLWKMIETACTCVPQPFWQNFHDNIFQKKIHIVIIQDFIRKLLSELILHFGKCPNRKTRESESAGFLFPALPKIQNWFRKQFSYKVLYDFKTKYFFRTFQDILKKISHTGDTESLDRCGS